MKIKRLLVYGLYLLKFLIFPGNAYTASAFNHEHGDLSALLKKYVVKSANSSSVNYQALKKDSSLLNSYLRSVGQVTKKDFNEFSKDQKLSFLINAYNAFTIKLIVDHYPIKSIKNIGGLFSNPWKKEFFKLLGEESSLDKIEHEMVRKWFAEPRIHFALVCASKGCPALREEAYTALKLEHLLEDSTKRFLRDKERNRFIEKEGKLEISSIFKWYADDFINAAGSVEAFIALMITTDLNQQKQIREKKILINYLDYDWSLNEYTEGKN